MKSLVAMMPDPGYELKSWAADQERGNVSAYAVFSATRTCEGGPCPPTGKTVHTDYVYVMYFNGDKFSRMTKIWNAGFALRELGWT